MKKLTILQFFIFSSSLFTFCKAQNPTYQQKLFYTCKVWGFVKYFHSNVSTCGVNWDSVLIHCLPLVKNAVTQNDFNNALDTMLIAAGPMAITHTPPCDTVPPELSRNLNFGWLNNPMLRTDVKTILDTIKNNFRPHAECWVKINPNQADGGYLQFSADSLMLNQDFATNYPDEWQRLLVLFKHWNIVNYFTFNIYIHDIPWDSTLMQNVLAIDNAPNDNAFNIAFRKFVSDMDDSHAQAFTDDYNSIYPMLGNCVLPFLVKYIPGHYVIAASQIPSMAPGDIITSINGLTTQQWEDSLKPYVSMSDTSATRDYLAEYMGTGPCSQPVNVEFMDSLNNPQTIALEYNRSITYYQSYYPNDTLATAHWKYWSHCNIGYVNVGQLQPSDISSLYSTLRTSNAIIFDVRNYPSSSAIWTLIYMMFPNEKSIAKYTLPDVTYPGTWYWQTQLEGMNGNPTAYNGKVIILMNEITGSDAEYVCQTLALMPHATKVGSQTWGADGDATFYRLGQDYQTGFTTLGWFLANGDSTQRIGIKPDSTVYPTQVGLRHGRDELLEKALEIAGSCPTSVSTINNPNPEITIYPNPSNGVFTIRLLGDVSTSLNTHNTVEVYNVLGEKVYSRSAQADDNTINLENLASGIYSLRLQTDNSIMVRKLVIMGNR